MNFKSVLLFNESLKKGEKKKISAIPIKICIAMRAAVLSLWGFIPIEEGYKVEYVW